MCAQQPRSENMKKSEKKTTETTTCRPPREAPPQGMKWIFRPWRRLPDGTIQRASQFGLRAFPMLVPVDE
jgi:hypothetical protein